ncbi:MAG: hypothetical protein JOZ17_00405, partial [Acetobacteraceae bacterium]|nr:hypothetical protein [Acetobacteraceae bacterium]
FIYATYFHCNSATVGTADKSVNDPVFKDALAGLLKQGKAASWGWLAKQTGGEWARAGYLTGSSVKAVLDAAGYLEVMVDAKPPVKHFEAACNTSEDYVWHVLAGNDARGKRGPVSWSTYYVCDGSREEQADALVKQALAPTYEKLVADKKIVTWLWAEHIIGGKYRRLATMTAESRDALISVREGLARANEHDPLDAAMTSICDSHQDYIWDVKNQGP